MGIVDKCTDKKCEFKEDCFRFGEKLRKGQATIFKYNEECVHFWDKKYTTVKQD